jgi:hypothetical protein
VLTFAADINLPLSKLTVPDNIVLRNRAWKSSLAILNIAEQSLAIFYYVDGSLRDSYTEGDSGPMK